MTRKQGDEILGELAISAWKNKTQFLDVLLENEEITSRLNKDILVQITDAFEYRGQSKEIVQLVAGKYYKKKTLEG